MPASVIIPAYNAEKTIGECLEALEGQSVKPKEIIVVDDGSTDKTAEIVSGFSGARLLKKSHGGPAKARNFGARKASGDLLVFTDSDCVPEKNWLKEMIAPFRDSKVVGAQGAYKTKQGGLTARFVQAEIEERYARMRKAESIDFIGSYSAAYRKKVFLKFGGFDEGFPSASGEDPELSFKLSEKKMEMVFSPDAVVFHLHPESPWKYFKVKFFRAYWRVSLYRKHKKKAVKDSYTPQLLKGQIGLLYLAFFSLIGIFAFPENYLFSAAVLCSAIILFLLSLLPFTANALGKDFALGIAAPFFLVLRSKAFALGLLAGMARGLLK